jgi:RNA-directed DNA polymerase
VGTEAPAPLLPSTLAIATLYAAHSSTREGVDTTIAMSSVDIRTVIADLNPILRGWGQYFRTGNAATRFIQVDGYV